MAKQIFGKPLPSFVGNPCKTISDKIYGKSKENKLVVLTSFFDNNGKPFFSLLEDGTIEIEEKFVKGEANAKIWNNLVDYLPRTDAYSLKCKIALTYCLGAMRALQSLDDSEESRNEAEALWSTALQKAEECF
jgi:hypothetical protein